MMNQELLLSLFQKGGPGSGNFGHAGRPGQVGGSGGGTGGGSEFHETSSQSFGKQMCDGTFDYMQLRFKDTAELNWLEGIVNETLKECDTTADTFGTCGEVTVTLWDKLGRPKDLVPTAGLIYGDEEHIFLYNRKEKMLIDPTGKQYDSKAPLVYLKENCPYKSFVKLRPADIQAYRDDLKERLSKKKGGPGSGNFGHAGRPGQVGGSGPGGGFASGSEFHVSGGVKWERVDSRSKANKQFKEKFNINRVLIEDDIPKDMAIKDLNKLGECLAEIGTRHPVVLEHLKKHRISSVTLCEDIKNYKGEVQSYVGLWKPPTGFGQAATIKLTTDYSGEFNTNYVPIGKLRRTTGSDRYTVSCGFLGRSVGAQVLCHELGHHMQLCIGKKGRREWDALVEKNGGATWLKNTISRYASTQIGTGSDFGDNPVYREEHQKQSRYSEGFSEAFAIFMTPGYKGKALPAPVHTFMSKYFGSTSKKSMLFSVWSKGGPGSGNFGHAGRPGQVGGSGSGASTGSSFHSRKESESDQSLKATMTTMAKFLGQNASLEGYKYKGAYDLILKEGEFFKLPDAKLPKGIKKGANKECYRNAFRLATTYPDKYTYCEGFAEADFMPGLPFAHAWVIENSTGKVIDNTWKTPGTSYYGIAFDTSYVIKTAVKTKVFGLIPDMITPEHNPFKDGFPKEAFARKQKGGPGSGNFGHSGRPGQVGGSAGTSGGVAGSRIRKEAECKKVSASKFADALHKNVDPKFKAYVTMYSAEEYGKMNAKTFLSKDGLSGFAVKPDGDIISVFSAVHGEGRGRYMIELAIAKGGTKLDCFEPLNKKVYEKYGFLETERFKWDDQYAPKDWNYKRDNHPDVVMMKYSGKKKEYKGGPGSGNFGHSGRPGQVGGSGTGGTGTGSEHHRTPKRTDISNYPKDAKDITPEMRMAQANYEDIQANMKRDLSKIAIGRPTLKEIDGNVGETKKAIIKNMLRQHEYYSAYLAGDSSNRVRDYIDHCRELLNSEDLAGVDGKKMNEMLINAIDNLYYQEMESNRQAFTDHGVRHIVGNIIRQDQIMMAATDGKATGMERLMGQFVMIHHDVGYTTPLIREGGLRGVIVTSDHPKFSKKILGEQSSIWDEDTGLFNRKQFDSMLDIVATHDSTKIDRSNMLATSIRVSDNLSLFSKEKLPGMFRYVENGQSLLSDMGLAAHAGDETKFNILKKNLHKQIDKSNISSQLKRDLKAATKEVTYLTPKFTLGVLAGEIKGISKEGNRVKVSIKYNDYDAFLQKHFDMGQKQTKKFLNDYGITDFSKKSYSIADFLDLVVD